LGNQSVIMVMVTSGSAASAMYLAYGAAAWAPPLRYDRNTATDYVIWWAAVLRFVAYPLAFFLPLGLGSR
jgi:hypothetical protein